MRRALFMLLGTLGIAAVAVTVCRTAIGDVYRIGSGSMEPTLMTGESVFLRYSGQEPNRFDIVAFKDEGGGASIKRTIGLREEVVLIDASGDLRIDDRYLHDEPARPEPTAIFDSSLQAVDEHWRHGGTAFDPWRQETDVDGGLVWSLDGDLVPRGSDQGLLRFQDRITDGRLLPDGRYQRGPSVVHDAVVEFEFRVLEAGGYLRVLLNEENDLFEASVFVYEGESASKVLIRRIRPSRFRDEGPAGFFGSLEAHVPMGEWIRLRMSNVDNRVSFQCGDESFHADYAQNTPRRDPETGRDEPFSAGERVKFGGSGLRAQFRNIRVLRDFHIVPRGSYGVGSAITLGADEVFVIGDNSSRSRDSRERGPISADRLIGTAEAVVKPLRAFRRL